MFRRDAVAAGLHALSREARAASPAGPGSSAARSPTGWPPTASRSSISTTSAPAGASSSRRARAPGATLVEGDVLDPDALDAGDARAATRSSTCRPTPTCATGSSTRSATSSRTRSRPRTCSRRCARPARRRIAFSLDRLGLRRARRSSRRPRTRRSRSRRRCTAASKLAGEGMIARLLPRLRLHRAWSSASSRSSASATRTATSSTSTARCRRDPTRLRVLGDGRQEKSYLYVQDCVDGDAHRRSRAHDGAGLRRLQPRHRRDARRRRLGRARSRAHLGVSARDRAHRRRARLGRRQPADPARLHARSARSAGRRG